MNNAVLLQIAYKQQIQINSIAISCNNNSIFKQTDI